MSRHGGVNGATPAIAVGPTKVEFIVFAKSTWNFQKFNVPEAESMFMTKFGEPRGGAVAPSTSAGSRLANAPESLKHTSAGAEAPLSIAVRLNAHASG